MIDRLSPWRALLVGLFVLVTGSLATAGLFAIGEHDYWFFKKTWRLRAEFASIGGVDQGTRVRIQGVDAGVVERIEAPTEPGQPVVLHLKLDTKIDGLIRQDAVALLVSEGFVGTKVVEIQPGSAASPAVASGDTIGTQQQPELHQVLANVDRVTRAADEQLQEVGPQVSTLLADLKGITENPQLQQIGPQVSEILADLKLISGDQRLRQVGPQVSVILARLERLTARVEEGEGSLGRFIMTDDAHQSAIAMMDAGDQLMNTLEESMAAFRRAWPVRNYFTTQGMNRPDEVLFRPGADREAELFTTRSLFEPDTSVLTTAGKARLRALAKTLNSHKNSETEIVVAAFDQSQPIVARAQKITQEQADAVRRYLMDEHSVHKVGFFGRRKITAAGFGNSVPSDQPNTTPAKRIEIVSFTPR